MAFVRTAARPSTVAVAFMATVFVTSLLLLSLVTQSSGHGMMMDPVNRASRWRQNASAPKDFGDNQLWCGGFYNQFGTHKGRCGICGDDFAEPTPRAHELGGRPYGEGVIVRTYAVASTITVIVLLTASHKGYFTFDLCNLDASLRESDECFQRHRLLLLTGEGKYTLDDWSAGPRVLALRLPEKVRCSHCVLRWTYVSGNSWGVCTDGTGALGCGNQEHFISCSDIAIV